MKTTLFTTLIVLTILLTACQSAAPLPPLTVTKGAEFILAQGQTATIANTDLAIRLMGVSGDERCPSEIECAASGPVSISLAVQMGDGIPSNVNLQSFTDNKGRSPEGQFEGIEDRAVYQGYLIRMTGVLPYPVNSTQQIKDSEYRVSLVVTQQ